MRTTVTLTPEADGIVRRLMRERSLTFKDALNTAIVSGSRPAEVTPYRVRTVNLGAALVPIDRAVEFLDELEDEKLIRQMKAGS